MQETAYEQGARPALSWKWVIGTAISLVAMVAAVVAVWPQLSWWLRVRDARVEVNINLESPKRVILRVYPGDSSSELIVPGVLRFDIYNGSNSPFSVRDAIAVPFQSDAYGAVPFAPISVPPQSNQTLSVPSEFSFLLPTTEATVITCGQFQYSSTDEDGFLLFNGVSTQRFMQCMRNRGFSPVVSQGKDARDPSTEVDSIQPGCTTWQTIGRRKYERGDSVQVNACACGEVRTRAEFYHFNADTKNPLDTDWISVKIAPYTIDAVCD